MKPYKILDATEFDDTPCASVRYIEAAHGSCYRISIESFDAVVIRTAKRHETDQYGWYKRHTPRRVGYLTFFPGEAKYDGQDIDGGVIWKAYVSSQFRRKGLATAMLDFARHSRPEKDIRHSSLLSDDAKGWAAATPNANDVLALRARLLAESRAAQEAAALAQEAAVAADRTVVRPTALADARRAAEKAAAFLAAA